jgi:hypothetical protein
VVERFTPSDFPLARIEQRTIDSLSDRYRVQGVEDVYPASPLQQGMVFHSMATPGSSLFITQLDCAFEGDLDARAMAGAWEAMLAGILSCGRSSSSTRYGRHPPGRGAPGAAAVG